MKVSSLVLAILVCKHATAHTLFTTLFVNDVDQGGGTCVRMPRDPPTATNPIVNLQGNEMMCGFDGDQAVDRVCPVPQSAKLSFLYRSWPDGTVQGSIDVSHKGPCAIYMKAQNLTGEWFKIWDEGYDQKTSQWCSEKIMQNNGILSVKIPSNLVGGPYLVRSELLSLHEADKNPPEPQFYIGCAQIYLNSTGTALPSETVNIPGHVSIQDPSMLYNIYNGTKVTYPLSGPKRYVSGISSFTEVDPQSPQKEGLLPANAILTNANWWGVEVPSYSDEQGCRKSAKSCFNQLDKCYSTAPPTGSKGCRVWEAKCDAISDNCNTDSPNGPPNAGKTMSVVHQIYSIPPAVNVDAQPATSQPTSPAPTTLISLTTTSSLPQSVPTTILDFAAEPLADQPSNVRSTISATSTTQTPISLPPTAVLSTDSLSSTSISISTELVSLTTSTSTSVSSSTSTTITTTSPPTSSSTSTSTSTTTTSSTTTTQIILSTFPPSLTEMCGEIGNRTSCNGNPYGRCCSKDCRCGNKQEHCLLINCQRNYGECGDEIWKEEEPKEAAKEKQRQRDLIVDRILQRRGNARMRRYWGM